MKNPETSTHGFFHVVSKSEVTRVLIQLAESVFAKHQQAGNWTQQAGNWSLIEFKSELIVVEDLVRELRKKGLEDGSEVRTKDYVQINFTYKHEEADRMPVDSEVGGPSLAEGSFLDSLPNYAVLPPTLEGAPGSVEAVDDELEDEREGAPGSAAAAGDELTSPQFRRFRRKIYKLEMCIAVAKRQGYADVLPALESRLRQLLLGV